MQKINNYIQFNKNYQLENILQARKLAIFANILYLMFLFLDGYLVGSISHEIVTVRVIFSVIIFLFILASYLPIFKTHWQMLFAFFIVFSAIGVIVMSSYLQDPIKTVYLQGLLLIIFYGYTMNRLLLYPAMFAGVSITLIYSYVYVIGSETNAMIFTTLFFQITANLFGIFNAFSKQKLLYQDFILKNKDKELTEKINAQNKELVMLNKKLNQLASTDGLTSLANRRYFDNTLNKFTKNCIKERFPLSLIMLDVDYFKRYNDKYGHIMGDECLKNIAILIKKSIVDTHGVAARYGGEEFCIILPNTDYLKALKVAKLIQEKLEKKNIPHLASPKIKHVTISIGIATAEKDYQHLNPKKLISYADTCLYKSKENGRNQVTGISI